jgi:hypothetical protein
MLASHTRVHGIREVKNGALTRVDNRSTYGYGGRSAALQHFNLKIAQLEGAGALILDGEALDPGVVHRNCEEAGGLGHSSGHCM